MFSASEYGLWFDVGIKRYTTAIWVLWFTALLWFDVGIKRYTTSDFHRMSSMRCGLM